MRQPRTSQATCSAPWWWIAYESYQASGVGSEDVLELFEGTVQWVFLWLALPAAAILVDVSLFLSALSSQTTGSNALIYLAYVAGVVLAVGLLALAVGLIRGRRRPEAPNR